MVSSITKDEHCKWARGDRPGKTALACNGYQPKYAEGSQGQGAGRPSRNSPRPTSLAMGSPSRVDGLKAAQMELPIPKPICELLSLALEPEVSNRHPRNSPVMGLPGRTYEQAEAGSAL